MERQNYPSLIAQLIKGSSLAPLGPGKNNSAVFTELSSLCLDSAFAGAPILNENMANSCISGLWLLHNYLDESHRISQAIDSTEGCYWHGIMHRREPDYSNAKYWFRQTGVHPIFDALRESAQTMAANEGEERLANELAASSEWDPFTFVDLCAEVAGTGSKEENLICRIAQVEWALLFDYCFCHAIES